MLSPLKCLVEDTAVLSKSKKISVRNQSELLKNVSDTYKKDYKNIMFTEFAKTLYKKFASEIRKDIKKLGKEHLKNQLWWKTCLRLDWRKKVDKRQSCMSISNKGESTIVCSHNGV